MLRSGGVPGRFFCAARAASSVITFCFSTPPTSTTSPRPRLCAGRLLPEDWSMRSTLLRGNAYSSAEGGNCKAHHLGPNFGPNFGPNASGVLPPLGAQFAATRLSRASHVQARPQRAGLHSGPVLQGMVRLSRVPRRGDRPSAPEVRRARSCMQEVQEVLQEGHQVRALAAVDVR